MPENDRKRLGKEINRIKIYKRLKPTGIWSLTWSKVGEGFLGRKIFNMVHNKREKNPLLEGERIIPKKEFFLNN